MNALIKLETMLGKTMYYRGKPTVIKSFDNSTGEFELLLEIEGRPTKFYKPNEEALDLFLSNFSEVEIADDETLPEKTQETPKQTGIVRAKTPETELYEENKKTFSTLSEMLLNDIEKVRNNPDYVPQAKQVCNSVNALVNMTRLQLQLVKNQ